MLQRLIACLIVLAAAHACAGPQAPAPAAPAVPVAAAVPEGVSPSWPMAGRSRVAVGARAIVVSGSPIASEVGRDIQVDLPLDRFEQLGLRPGETVYVSAKRARVFTPEYVI